MGVGCHSLLQGSPRPRHRTWVSCVAGRFFTVWATRGAWWAVVCGVAKSRTQWSDWCYSLLPKGRHGNRLLWIYKFNVQIIMKYLFEFSFFKLNWNRGWAFLSAPSNQTVLWITSATSLSTWHENFVWSALKSHVSVMTTLRCWWLFFILRKIVFP